jgi:transposase
MGKVRRKFDADFKRKIVAEVTSGALTRNAAARKYSISPSVIKKWEEKISEGILYDSPSSRERELEREVKELKEKIGDLVMEVDALKKMELYAQRLRKLNTSVITASNLDQFKKPAK